MPAMMDPTEFQPDRSLPSERRHLPYVPMILRATPVRAFEAPPIKALLLDNIQTAGIVRYRYVLTVFENGDYEDPLLVISSELFSDGPTYAIGVFTESGHETLNPISDDWADLDKFCHRALELVQKRKGIILKEFHFRKSWWNFW